MILKGLPKHIMISREFPKVIGVAGVSPNETEKALRIYHLVEWPMMILALWIIVEWYLQAAEKLTPEFVEFTDWLIWAMFLFETVLITCVVRDRSRYLKDNWINLVIVVFGCPIWWYALPSIGLLRGLRLLVLLSLLVQVSKTAREVLARNHLGTTLMIGFMLMLAAGFLIAGIDPSIGTPWDGVWWAWVTMTTVGYGDIVPSTTAGRLFGSFVILIGMGIFSMLTASFSAFLMSKEEQSVLHREQLILTKLEALEIKLGRIERAISMQMEAAQENESMPETSTPESSNR